MPACLMGCTVKGQHLAACGQQKPCPCSCHNGGLDRVCDVAGGCHQAHEGDQECAGCLPRDAEPGSMACRRCCDYTLRNLRELPDLWVDLAERSRLKGVSGEGAGGGDVPGPISEDGDLGGPIAARTLIRSTLVTWCEILHDTRHLTVPDEEAIAATTRRIAAYESQTAGTERLAAYSCSLRDPDTGVIPRDPEGLRRHKVSEHRHANLAANARNDRETGRDVVANLAEHVSRQVGPLLADRDLAEALVTDMREAIRQGRRWANRSRPVGITFTCPTCSERVRIATDTSNDATCPSCGDTGDARWWMSRQPAITDGPTTIVGLREWLFFTRGTDVPLETLRTWTKRTDREGNLLMPEIGRDERGRKLYNPLQAVILLESRTQQRRYTA